MHRPARGPFPDRMSAIKLETPEEPPLAMAAPRTWITNCGGPLGSKSPERFREMLCGQVDEYVTITKAIGINLD